MYKSLNTIIEDPEIRDELRVILKQIGNEWANQKCGDYSLSIHDESVYLYFGYIEPKEATPRSPPYNEIMFSNILDNGDDFTNHIHLYFGDNLTTLKTVDIGVATQKFLNIHKGVTEHICLMSGIYDTIVMTNELSIAELTNTLYTISGYSGDYNTKSKSKYNDFHKKSIPIYKNYYINKSKLLNEISENILGNEYYYNKLYSCNLYHKIKNYKINPKFRSRNVERSIYKKLNNINLVKEYRKYTNTKKNTNLSKFGNSLNVLNDKNYKKLNLTKFNDILYNGKPFYTTQKMKSKIKQFQQKSRQFNKSETNKVKKQKLKSNKADSLIAEKARIKAEEESIQAEDDKKIANARSDLEKAAIDLADKKESVNISENIYEQSKIKYEQLKKRYEDSNQLNEKALTDYEDAEANIRYEQSKTNNVNNSLLESLQESLKELENNVTITNQIRDKDKRNLDLFKDKLDIDKNLIKINERRLISAQTKYDDIILLIHMLS